MDKLAVIVKVNEYLHIIGEELGKWLGAKLPKISDNWWQECVLDKLSYNQRQQAEAHSTTTLSGLDLAALLRVAEKNWYGLNNIYHLLRRELDNLRAMKEVRNNWAHCSESTLIKENVIQDISVIAEFLEQLGADRGAIGDVVRFKEYIENADFEQNVPGAEPTGDTPRPQKEIEDNDIVYIVGHPDKKGMVAGIEKIGETIKYKVFIDGGIKTFYSGQIALVDSAPKYKWIDLPTLRSYLSAYEINNPSAGSLYSLNSARIDFVPYQFRPALKLIKSDEPRILIADSVGVGKTIEAGLIIKELEARNDINSILIVCPKPLVAERKWELEMKRFDEDFIPLRGDELREAINDTDRLGEWPTKYKKIIVPYSALDSRTYDGDSDRVIPSVGLSHLDPAPEFDLVIVDEAHHIRNGSMESQKAFAYKSVRYFCEHAKAVVMLTATPLQTSDNDLYTLLNVLRPDLVIDKFIFSIMAQPNEYVSKCASIIRRAEDNWQDKALEALDGVVRTQWGDSVISELPVYKSVVSRLEKETISREDRVKLLTDVESLHSFNNMLNRTRRKDIEDFCIRRPYMLESEFTPEQKELHDALLQFEKATLGYLHGHHSVPFMISTIRRQAASCIFGLAPHMKDLINRRFVQIEDDPEVDYEDYSEKFIVSDVFKQMGEKILALAENLPEEDPKFDGMLGIINEKQKEDNNKIIIFSTYRYTLYYIKTKLQALNYRVNQIDGSVSDEERYEICSRFKLPKDDRNALDILLFTEVGSEGLDYQFCNTMINYDLPWNPMRIEQRIGRIDRRGQESEFVNIYNLITTGTIDADIYERCLKRIGVFERSIGECEEILGSLGKEIEKVANNAELTDQERKDKLEQMADNSVRRLQELDTLENEQKELFGFDFSAKKIAQELEGAESPWISAKNLQNLAELYICGRIGEGRYFHGDGEGKTLRLSASARAILREDLAKLTNVQTGAKRQWEQYLKGTKPGQVVTFDTDYATKNKQTFLLNAMHPLIKQAAKYFEDNLPTYISMRYDSPELESGEYAVSLYGWNYVGEKPHFSLVAVCENDKVADEFVEIVQGGSTWETTCRDLKERWDGLEAKQIKLWTSERQKNEKEIQQFANTRMESLRSNFQNRKKILEKQIEEAADANIIRMKKAELQNAEEVYEAKQAKVKERVKQSDIHTTLIANGIIRIN